MRGRLVVGALALALLYAEPARAIDFRIKGEPFRLGIVETMYGAYHGDLPPYLITETDAAGRPTNSPRFGDILNRLNVDLQWRRLRLWTRFDTAAYIGRPDGACGPEAITPISLRSRFCQNPFFLEKIALEYVGRSVEATLGDFYVSFGRGLVLSIRKLDELGVDTTLRGGKFIYHQGNAGATLVAGVTNIQNVDQATGRWASDPNDFIAGGRVEYRLLDKVILGVHEVGGFQGRNRGGVPQLRRDGFFMYGATLDAPRLTRWLSLYLEGAGQLTVETDQRKSGYALYGAATGYFGPVAVLLEGKYYQDYQRWPSSVPTTYVEFASVTYTQPPTAERVVTELSAPVFDVRGGRLRIDYRVNPWLLLFASTAYFQDDSADANPLAFHDPYGGAELRWQNGSSHLFPSGGYRLEQNRSDGSTFQYIGHVEWDLTQQLPRGLSLESQGFVLFRQEELVTQTLPDGTVVNPRWTEGTAYVAIKWTPHLIAAAGYEWTTRPTGSATQHYVNGSLQWNITTASSLRLFVGGNRGGLRCISGICRDFPAFTGARLEVVVRL